MIYTDLELVVIKAFHPGFNYNNPEDEKADNATALTVEDVVGITKLNNLTAKGVIGSLHKKGLLVDWGEPDMKGISRVTDEGIDAYYKYIQEDHAEMH